LHLLKKSKTKRLPLDWHKSYYIMVYII
jgi:hypothetical protein